MRGPGPSSVSNTFPCPVHHSDLSMSSSHKQELSAFFTKKRKTRESETIQPYQFSMQAPEPSPHTHPSWAISNVGLASSNAVSFPHERDGGIWSQLICIDKNLALLSPSYLSFLCTLITKHKPAWGIHLLSCLSLGSGNNMAVDCFILFCFAVVIFVVLFSILPFFKFHSARVQSLPPLCNLDASFFLLQLWCKHCTAVLAKPGMSTHC